MSFSTESDDVLFVTTQCQEAKDGGIERRIAKVSTNDYLYSYSIHGLIVVPCSTNHAARIASGEIRDRVNHLIS
jgi:hypothetical protein